MSKPSQIRIVGDIAYVQLSRGKESVIDAEDVHCASGFRWTAYKGKHTYYAKMMLKKADGKWTKEPLHRRIMKADQAFQIDHINGDGLDNRKVNLRVATNTQNQWNSRLRVDNKSGFKGVYFDRLRGKWRSVIRVSKVKKHLGTFNNPADAYAAYVKASIAYRGEFGRI